MRFQYNGDPIIIYGSQIMIDKDVSSQELAAIAKKQGETDDSLMKDLKPVKYWLCSVGRNNNNDYWGEDEMAKACSSILYKPININHTRLKEDNSPQTIIGINYASEIKKNPENEKTSIFCKGYLYTYLYSKNETYQKIEEAIEENKAFASMECAFTEYDAVHPETGEIITSIETETQFDEAFKSKTIARKFGNPTFIGSAFLIGVSPADPYCYIYSDEKEQSKAFLNTLSQIYFTLKDDKSLFDGKEADTLLQTVIATLLQDKGIQTELCLLDDSIWLLASDGKKYRVSSDGIRVMEGGQPKIKIASSYLKGIRTLLGTLCDKQYLDIFDKIK